MNTKLKGFIALPSGRGLVFYVRLSSIDAVYVCLSNTVIQLHGCPDSDDAFTTPLSLEEVISLIAAAQDG